MCNRNGSDHDIYNSQSDMSSECKPGVYSYWRSIFRHRKTENPEWVASKEMYRIDFVRGHDLNDNITANNVI